MLLTESGRAQTWSLFVDPDGQPGAINMAMDARLVEEADRTGGAILRLYRFAPPCLSFGRNEPARERYDRQAISRLGLDVVRRPTGGRAVWHEYEVTYAVAAPVAAFGSLRKGYLAIHARLAAALRSLGADATLASDRPTAPGRPGPCFTAAVGGEVLVGGHKVIGSAQVRLGDAFLQHGSILLDGSQEVIGAVSRQPSAVSRETTLSTALGRPVTFSEVAAMIVRAWDEQLSPTAPYRPLPPPTAWFSDPAWTWRR